MTWMLSCLVSPWSHRNRKGLPVWVDYLSALRHHLQRQLQPLVPHLTWTRIRKEPCTRCPKFKQMLPTGNQSRCDWYEFGAPYPKDTICSFMPWKLHRKWVKERLLLIKRMNDLSQVNMHKSYRLKQLMYFRRGKSGNGSVNYRK